MPGWNEILDKETLAVKAMMSWVTVDALPESVEEMKMMAPKPTEQG
jgi:hypothetical protein